MQIRKVNPDCEQCVQNDDKLKKKKKEVCLFTVECFLLDCALFVVCMGLTMFTCEIIY